MMMNIRFVHIGLAATLVGCAVGAWQIQKTGETRATARVGVAPNPVAEMIVAGLGGFRGLASEVVWFRADRLQDEGRYAELAQLSTWLTFLDPYAPEVWAYAAWNLAYNVSVMMPTAQDRWRWVDAGLKLLRDDGLRLNPSDAVLHKELAWMFLLKIGGTLDDASPYYREQWKARVADCQKTGDWSPLKLDADGRAAIDAEYGRQDWTTPLASALYWAHRGLAFVKTPVAELELRQIICQALVFEAQTDAAFAPRAYQEMQTVRKLNPNVFPDKIVENFRAHYNLPSADGK